MISPTLAERAAAVIPSSAQTYSKSYTRWPDNAPRFIQKADGAYVWDIDGRKYLDYDAALGPVILGHHHPNVNAAIDDALKHGISFPLPTYPEVKLAELLVEIIPCAEMCRFGKNGADATAAAVKLARAATGHEYIFYHHPHAYHGKDDWFQASFLTARGVPLVLHQFVIPFNNLRDLADRMKHVVVAAVIVEPIQANNPVLPEPGFLEGIRELCDWHNALLIFDEVFTGFRFPELSAQAHFGVTPDLACFSKAMANGMPISAVVGRRDIMKLLDEGVFYSTTFAGETLSIAAAIATIEELKTGEPLKRIWEHGTEQRKRLDYYVREYNLSEQVQVLGWPARIVLKWRDPEHSRIFNEVMIDRNVLFNGYMNIMAAHGETELDIMDEAMHFAFSRVSVAIAEGVTA